ncbi:3-hydroxybutyryl-CoA dehydrogenase [Thermanaerosceptrum fracticalcis]|uniref:3-hydroxybutyryl-CoA dehydrogenase n=1 Tax=Thermanaerosceptrum fracticalcis TaxID=1712410 RepID=A0A7G6DYP4_THEFR|nr:3-hydroxyacyl-CoA dehydrogenase NAD-binding domain-containing protein [Thermanaerosceptrum fracticalcis]QNB44948.1 3-hydroxybutyryl-CoA dehydrogenase [Thermanaerosceptrum fracticalcis]
MQKIFVIGAGTMGRGIAQVASQAKYLVYISDINIDVVKKSLDMVKSGLDRQVEKGKMTKEEVQDIMDRIKPVEGMEKVNEADFIIEAALEDVALKQKIFKELDEKSNPQAILATNTTSCSITEIASATRTPERVVGMHFFNPPILMKLVEIMPGILTADETVDKTKDLALKMGKDPVVTKKEGPAGVTSRILAGLLNEAVWVLHEGIATVDAIDKAVVMGCNHRMGPFALIDLIGVDIHLAKTQMLYNKTGDDRYRPCYLLEQMVQAGLLGKKAGRGFYDYSKDPAEPVDFFKK